jgi:hypothetical protein
VDDIRSLLGRLTIRRVVVGLVAVWLFLLLLVDEPGIGGIVLAAAGVWLYFRYRRRERERAAEVAEDAAMQAEVDEEVRYWKEATPPDGPYAVELARLPRGDREWLVLRLSIVSQNPALELPEAEILVDRVEHIGPQPLASDVDVDYAIRLKKYLERTGAELKITEGASRMALDKPRREPIHERVRHEVWRRDGGACVDCGSRERLEYDHIVPVSKGGANTARNIELRCETCNRRKAAKV